MNWFKPTERNILPILGIMTGIGLVLYSIQQLMRAESDLPGMLPPIIIKSGSFVIESDEILHGSGGTGGNPHVYKRLDFKEINVMHPVNQAARLRVARCFSKCSCSKAFGVL
jgi:hypothetical protein